MRSRSVSKKVAIAEPVDGLWLDAQGRTPPASMAWTNSPRVAKESRPAPQTEPSYRTAHADIWADFDAFMRDRGAPGLGIPTGVPSSSTSRRG